MELKQLKEQQLIEVNIKFITKFFTNWIDAKKDKKHEWLFYNTKVGQYKYSCSDDYSLAFNNSVFLESKRVFVVYPFKYLNFNIYEATDLESLRDYLMSEAVLNDYIDMYIIPFDYNWCIKFEKAEGGYRELNIQSEKEWSIYRLGK